VDTEDYVIMSQSFIIYDSPPLSLLSLSHCAVGFGMSQKLVETGKCWVQNAFEQISNELKNTVVIVHWDLRDNDPAYHLCFQIAGQEEETLSFTRGTLKTCGKSHHEAVRRRVEATIRNRLVGNAKS
jgi:hypothetical protein